MWYTWSTNRNKWTRVCLSVNRGWRIKMQENRWSGYILLNSRASTDRSSVIVTLFTSHRRETLVDQQLLNRCRNVLLTVSTIVKPLYLHVVHVVRILLVSKQQNLLTRERHFLMFQPLVSILFHPLYALIMWSMIPDYLSVYNRVVILYRHVS